MTTAIRQITAEELLAIGDIGRCELIRGEIVPMSRAGSEYGRIAAKMLRVIANFVHEKKLGVVMAAETGYTIERKPDTVRAPDVSFIVASRYAPTQKFFEGSPDLAIEVMSPSDTWSEVNQKVDGWLAGGCRSCWVVDPKTQSITIYGAANAVLRLKAGDQLTDEPVLPGFIMPVAEAFSL
jgi:Uma2 family endonuclease